MHNIEPYYAWRNLYTAEGDECSPFHGRQYNEFEFTEKIYNHYLHPQWDSMGSPTLFIKILYVGYDEKFAIIELIGEWNDCLHNDIMLLKRNIVDEMVDLGINKFILLGENVLNFHGSDDCYYEEWFDELDDGWIALIGFREHVLSEFSRDNIDQYFVSGEMLNEMQWRTYRPLQLFQKVEQVLNRRIGFSHEEEFELI
ncbi:MAG: hypothetical protein COA57_04300 [Flavobacteriales bacterium]|nr:MAG: hypothetical protein COA57_04300 [Flavobacteriales bacterium]